MQYCINAGVYEILHNELLANRADGATYESKSIQMQFDIRRKIVIGFRRMFPLTDGVFHGEPD